MYKENLKFTLRCPKHKGYNPIEGVDGIRGGCVHCSEIFEVKESVLDLLLVVKKLKDREAA